MFVFVFVYVVLQLALHHFFHLMPTTHHEYWWFVRHGRIYANVTGLIQQFADVISHGHWSPLNTALRAPRQRTERSAGANNL